MSRRLRAAIVDPASWSLAYDAPLGAALARAGWDVTLHCTRSPHGANELVDEADGMRVRESFYRSGYGLGVLPRRVGRAVQHPLDLARLTRQLRRDADAVLVQWLPGRGVDSRAWARLARELPVTFTAHNAQERLETLDPRLLAGFSAVIAHSDGGAQALRDAGMTEVWRMSIGAYDQYATAPDPVQLPPELPAAVHDGAPLVVLPGLLRPYKGVDVLLDAWPEVLARVPSAQLVIAGRPMGVTLPSSPPTGVTLIPRFVSEQELGWLLRRAHICCLPYRQIDMSGIAAAALACGTPLVLSDVGGLGEYVGRGARTVPPEQPAALAAALIEVLASDTLQHELREEARVAVRDHYSWDAIAAGYDERLRAFMAARN